MPNATTLESLSIEVGATSEKASRELNKLSVSLKTLESGISSVLPGLRELTQNLKSISGLSGIRLPNFSNMLGSEKNTRTIRNTTKAITENANAIKDYRELPIVDAATGNPTGKVGMVSGDKFLGVKDATKGVAQGAEETKEVSENIKKIGEEAEKAQPKVKGLASQIGRIAKTMLIRTALRSLMKGFSESWQAAYEFSNKMNGSFARSVDASREIIANATTTVVQSFAPVLEALVPVINVVAVGIQYLCQGLQWLLSLLGLTSDLFGKNVSDINKYIGASDKANKSNKNLLASWDKLNIIQSKNSNSGSGKGGYKPGSLKNLISAETSAITQIIVGEGMLAVGLIMALSGHLGLGIGMMAIGAAAIAKTLVVDWQTLPNQVKKTIAEIMAIVGAASLALGTILLFTGHIGLGAGLIALGAANMVAVTAVTWGEDITSGIKQMVGKILAIAGVSMLALGMILMLTPAGTGIGFGLLLAGCASLVTAVALNWTSIVETVKGVMTNIGDWFVEKWNLIEGAVSAAWSAVSNWWEENISSKISSAWESVKDFFTGVFDGISLVASTAWESISGWWADNIAEPVKKSWGNVETYFSTLFGSSETPGSIANIASTAWDSVSEWWTTNVTAEFEKEGVWGGVKGFFSGLFGDAESGTGILGFANNAWNEIGKWWTTDVDPLLKSAWEPVSTFFSNFWGDPDRPGTIAGFVNDAWVEVAKFWTTNVTGNISPVWDAVSDFFKDIWEGQDGNGGIKGYAESAWTIVSKWWETGIAESIKSEGVWGGISGFFKGIFVGEDGTGGIVGYFNTMWGVISTWWGDKVLEPLKAAWTGIATWFHNSVTMPVGNFFIDMINGIINAINWVVDQLNTINITIPAVSLPLVGKVWDETKIGISGIQHITPLERIEALAEGKYGIPRGDLFIANEAGAELVGSMNGKTTVANQGQIIEGIQRGVRDANSEQNELLRRQNELLRDILENSGRIVVEPSAEWGKFNERSADMWSMATGR